MYGLDQVLKRDLDEIWITPGAILVFFLNIDKNSQEQTKTRNRPNWTGVPKFGHAKAMSFNFERFESQNVEHEMQDESEREMDFSHTGSNKITENDSPV